MISYLRRGGKDMYCKKCGTPITGDHYFCTNCGTRAGAETGIKEKLGMGTISPGRRSVMILAAILLVVGIAFFATKSHGIVGKWQLTDIEFTEEAREMIEEQWNQMSQDERESVEAELDGRDVIEYFRDVVREEKGVDLFDTTMEFHKDGSFYTNAAGVSAVGSWTFDNSVLTVTYNGQTESMTATVKGNKLKVAESESGISAYAVFKRV